MKITAPINFSWLCTLFVCCKYFNWNQIWKLEKCRAAIIGAYDVSTSQLFFIIYWDLKICQSMFNLTFPQHIQQPEISSIMFMKSGMMSWCLRAHERSTMLSRIRYLTFTVYFYLLLNVHRCLCRVNYKW